MEEIKVGITELRKNLSSNLQLVNKDNKVLKVYNNRYPVAIIVSNSRYKELLALEEIVVKEYSNDN
jgi:PHD/YefM family antitoxin component YafN of YafNO toxin-antitoxin module